MSASVSLGPLTIHFYGLIIGVGIYAGVKLAEPLVKRVNLSFGTQALWDGLMYALLGGIVGARLYHVVDLWSYYSANLTEIVAVWNGGLGIYGAILGGVLGIWWYVRRENINVVEALDVAALAMPIGQAIGRWGNFVNQELYGLPTQLPWGIRIDEANLLPEYSVEQRFHPLFLYESLGMLMVYVVLRWVVLGKTTIGKGQLFWSYLMGYAVVRSLTEALRIDPWSILGVPVALIISGMILVIGIWRLYVIRGKQ